MAAPGQTQVSDPAVAELQRVLIVYAQATGFTPALPGPVDGIVGTQTALAVMAMVPRLPGLPSEIVAMAPLISLVLATDQGRAEVFGLVRRNAANISRAVIVLEAYRLATGAGGGAPPAPPPAGGWKSQTVRQQWASGVLAPPPASAPPAPPPAGGGLLVPWWQTTKGKIAIGAGVAAALLATVVVIRAFQPG